MAEERNEKGRPEGDPQIGVEGGLQVHYRFGHLRGSLRSSIHGTDRVDSAPVAGDERVDFLVTTGPAAIGNVNATGDVRPNLDESRIQHVFEMVEPN